MWSASQLEDRPGSADVQILEGARDRLVAKLRLGTALALLVALLLQGASGQVFLAAAALLLYVQIQRACQVNPAHAAMLNWARLDVVIYAGVAAATGGIHSPLLVFTLFPVVIVGFKEGARGALTALLLSLAAAVLVPGLIHDGEAVVTEWPWTMVFLPSLLLALVLWGRSELSTLRRLAAVHDLQKSLLSCADPGRWVAELSQSLRRACDADACLVMISSPGTRHWTMAYANAKWSQPLAGHHATQELPAPVAAVLQGGRALFASQPRSAWSPPLFEIIQPFSNEGPEIDPGTLAGLDRYFGHKPLASFPLLSGQKNVGRVFIVCREGLSAATVRNLFQHTSQMALMLEKLWHASEAGTLSLNRTRRKISRDLHDGAIQPIIGLKLALEALKRKADRALSMEVDDLIRMTSDGIQDLRQYIASLKEDHKSLSAPAKQTLLDALQQQAKKFSDYHGIRTKVLADANIAVDSHLREEIVYIVKEGLSNIRRHSNASNATISLKPSPDGLILKLLNDEGTSRLQDTGFFPKSIGERALDLGGSVSVQRSRRGLTSVEIKLPLAQE